ncbi:hypothetical protein CVT24_002389, partial [Panaeolus cyanescens]
YGPRGEKLTTTRINRTPTNEYPHTRTTPKHAFDPQRALAAEMSSHDNPCPVLTGPENFQIWQIRLPAKLAREKCYDVIIHDTPSIASSYSTTSLQTPSTPSPSDSKLSATELQEWSIRNHKARGIIIEHVDDRLALEIGAMDSAKKMWEHLVSIHQTKNVGITSYFTFTTIINLKWDGTPDSIQKHIAAFSAARAKLQSLKKPIDDELLAYCLLSSLPNDDQGVWENFRTSVLSNVPEGQELRYATVVDRLVATALRQGHQGTANQDAAFNAVTKNKWCIVHKVDSHNTEDCNAIKNLQQNSTNKFKGGKGGGFKKGKKKQEKANRVVESSSDSGDSDGDCAHAGIVDTDVFITKSLKNRIMSYLGCDKSSRKTSAKIILDSGATAHMTPHFNWFKQDSYRKLSSPKKVRFGDDSFVEAIGIGTVILQSTKLKRGKLQLHNVLHIPSFTISLVSVGRLADKGLRSTFERKGCSISRAKTTIVTGKRTAGLYRLSATAEMDISALSAMDINTLHRRLGHVNHDALKRMVSSGSIEGVTKVTGTAKFCEPCTIGKLKKSPFSHKGQRANIPFQVIHSDVGGPISPADRYGYRYWISFIDDYSRYPWVFFMKEKSQALNIFRDWRDEHLPKQLEAESTSFHLSPNFLKFFRSDNGGEYTSNAFLKELKSSGTVHQTTTADTPEQNGLAERMNQTLANGTVALLVESGLPKSYWTFAMSTCAFTTARTPAAGLRGKSPYEVLYNRKVDVSWLRPFGCTAYALIPKPQRPGKFYNKARKSVMLGYTSEKKGYRLMDLKTRAVFHSRHVKFNEDELSAKAFSEPPSLTAPETRQWGDILRPHQDSPHDSSGESDDEDTGCPRSDSPPPAEAVGDNPDAVGDTRCAPTVGADGVRVGETEVNTPPSAPRKRQRIVYKPAPDSIAGRIASRKRGQQTNTSKPENSPSRHPPSPPSPSSPSENPENPEAESKNSDSESERDDEEVLQMLENYRDAQFAFAGHASIPHAKSLPRTIKEALNGPDSKHWREALDDELNSFEENDVKEVVPIPEGVKPITSKIVPKIKFDANGNIERYKIRIVARGFTQREGVDYQEVFAPVANLESIRIILALAAKHDLELDQMDVQTAYLNGKLTEDLYLLPPDGVDIPKGHCWKLKKSLYGLKQAGRTWNKTFDSSLKDLGFTRLDAETCLYVMRGEGGKLCFLVVYVDDLILAATSRAYMDEIKTKLAATFKMRDLGPASYVLGIQIRRDRRKRIIGLSQRQYIDTVLKRCGMEDCKPVFTPLSTQNRLTADDPINNDTLTEMTINNKTVSYATVVGSLMYAMMGTRPDIAYATGLLGRFSTNPKRCHWEAAKRVLRYLKGTRDLELQFDGNDVSMDMSFHGYSDADWSGDPETSKSTSGYVFLSSRGAIGWASKRQSLVALSSTESEYVGLCTAGQHLAWLRNFFEDIGHPQTQATELKCDNQAAITLSRDAQFRARTKHIQRKYHYLRDDLVANGHAVIRYVPTDDMVADIFTKALPHDKHWKFTQAMGLRPHSSGSVKTDAH